MKSLKMMAYAAAVVSCWAVAAQAHEFRCEKTVNGDVVYQIMRYPATLHYEIVVTNTHPSLPSVALSVDDTLMDQLGLTFEPEAPFTLDVGESVTTRYTVEIPNADVCFRMADHGAIENIFTIEWDMGRTSCSALVLCKPKLPPPPPPGGGVATRTMGFYKTHEAALQQCLTEAGTIHLGDLTLGRNDLVSALGLLWGSPAFYPMGGHRSMYDAAWFRLARQTLVGICNETLFGTVPTPSDLLELAQAALSGGTCQDMNTLEGEVDAYNNSGDNEPFPAGFIAGPATPRHARSIAVDPTEPTRNTCK